MRFLRRHKTDKTIIVLSDLHLGAGVIIDGRRNFLEDFHNDEELVDLFQYYSSGDYASTNVEIIINGDFIDLLAVPFIKYFDDEFWSEEASLEKLKMILDAHPEVIDAMSEFLMRKNKKVTYVLGNHDAELIHHSLQRYFIEKLPEKCRDGFHFWVDDENPYCPIEGVHIFHGHQNEIANSLHFKKSVIEDENNRRYYLPPWGSYYVTRVVNKFKEERNYVNAVRPYKQFFIYGLIYDTLFTIRFFFATLYYFFMVRMIFFYKQKRGFKKFWRHVSRELQLSHDDEACTRTYFQNHQDARVVIFGHTHGPKFRPYSDGKYFINTGTWMKMHHLNFDRYGGEGLLTYAQLDFQGSELKDISLNNWRGTKRRPFEEMVY